MLIDTHCHVVFGVDDASQEIERAMKMLEVAVKDGVKKILCTPHSLPGLKYENDYSTLMPPFEQLKQAVKEREMPIELYLGCEFFLSDYSISWLKERREVTLNGTNRLLIEFPWYQKVKLKSSEDELIAQVIDMGYRVIIAHPERYSSVVEDFDTLKRWRKLGCDFQVNRTGLILNDDKVQEALSWRMVEEGYCDVIATDAHGYTGKRIIVLQDIYDEVSRRMGKEIAERLLCENPQRLIDGLDLIH